MANKFLNSFDNQMPNTNDYTKSSVMPVVTKSSSNSRFNRLKQRIFKKIKINNFG